MHHACRVQLSPVKQFDSINSCKVLFSTLGRVSKWCKYTLPGAFSSLSYVAVMGRVNLF